ncbi:esterase E4-like [Vanessa tameamea]|uniref:Esterase E4-like n=1 Tax=Vanessa tameamea TaxID=334116 RepID=A0A8B8I872_VANTA
MATSKTSLLIILVIYFANYVIGNVIVDTKSGKVEGKEVNSIIPNKKYYSFLSIPYAQAPIGELRFKAPVPHPGWSDVLEAKKEKKHCAQHNLPIRQIKTYGFCGVEDCLHLNIHTPNLPDNKNSKLPIIVFLYNENFKVSYNATKEYGPDFLMNEDVILVTINHRLGALGFVSFEDELIPGNNGIRDVILALRWIKDNISYFAGDPLKVTLMGNSGGAAIVDILLHSPKAKGLFSAAIMQSDSSFNPLYFDENPKKRAISLTETLEDKATTSASFIERLSEVPAMKITDSEFYVIHADEARAIQRGILPFGPVAEIEHDDAIITKIPEKNPVELPVPVMIGFNSRQSMELNSRYLHSPQYLTFADRDFLILFPKRVDYHFQIHDEVYNKAIEEIKNFYFDEGYIKVSRPGQYLSYIGDILNFYHIDYTVRTYTNTSSTPIYYYMFDYSGELNFRKKMILEDTINFDGTWGASLGDELCYLFVCNKWRKQYKKLLENEDSEEIKVLQNMVKMVTDFAKTGNPTPPGSEFTWKPATKENRECLVISDELKIVSKLYDDKIKFWDEFIEKYGKMAVDGVVKDVVKDEL